MPTPSSSHPAIHRHALRFRQGPDYPIYLFSIPAVQISKIAGVHRMRRSEEGQLMGYQRPEVRRHIDNILDYLDGPEVLFPNSLIIAFSSQVYFDAHSDDSGEDGQSIGKLSIPIPPQGSTPPGWIVDGQQRSYALAETTREDLLVPVTAFVTDDISVQRDQFLRINSVKPLPKRIITELLPAVDTTLPDRLEVRKVPSMLCNRLAEDPISPFWRLIRRPSTPRSEYDMRVVNDTSLIKVIEDSLNSASGCLFPYQNLATGDADVDTIWEILCVWWAAVQNTFPAAWGKRPRESRLMHSVGIRAMGSLMDRVMPAIDFSHPDAVDHVEQELKPLQSVCKWTGGHWEDLNGLAWNELKCTTRHLRALKQYLANVHIQNTF